MLPGVQLLLFATASFVAQAAAERESLHWEESPVSSRIIITTTLGPSRIAHKHSIRRFVSFRSRSCRLRNVWCLRSPLLTGICVVTLALTVILTCCPCDLLRSPCHHASAFCWARCPRCLQLSALSRTHHRFFSVPPPTDCTVTPSFDPCTYSQAPCAQAVCFDGNTADGSCLALRTTNGSFEPRPDGVACYLNAIGGVGVCANADCVSSTAPSGDGELEEEERERERGEGKVEIKREKKERDRER